LRVLLRSKIAREGKDGKSERRENSCENPEGGKPGCPWEKDVFLALIKDSSDIHVGR